MCQSQEDKLFLEYQKLRSEHEKAKETISQLNQQQIKQTSDYLKSQIMQYKDFDLMWDITSLIAKAKDKKKSREFDDMQKELIKCTK